MSSTVAPDTVTQSVPEATAPSVVTEAPRRAAPTSAAGGTVFAILVAVSFSHMLNDLMQSLIPAIYPLLKSKFSLSFAQVGLITLVFQLTASMLQPVVGLYTDRRPMPFSLATGMAFTLVGLLVLSQAGSYSVLLLGASLVGMGSSVFHPESSRVARMASGGRYGFAQSFFQVGGNAGQSLGPLLAAFVVLPHGQSSISWFSGAALVAMGVLTFVGFWYRGQARASTVRKGGARSTSGLSRRKITISLAVLLALMFSKNVYTASIGSYYTFYLIDRFHVTAQDAQIHLFIFLGAVAVGTLVGGPVGDRFGRKLVIWVSILGVLPFTLALPHVGLLWTGILTVFIGLIMASAFSAILVYAQDLLPGKIGTIAGLFFGLSFGIGGLGAAALGVLADATSIRLVYQVCAFLPVIGLLTVFLPDIGRRARPATA